LLPSIELDFLIRQVLVEVKNLIAVSCVSLNLVEVLLSGNIDLGPLLINGSAGLEIGLFRDPRLVPPCSECFFLSREFPLPHEELLNHCVQRRCRI
jgi:hypothetical protein